MTIQFEQVFRFLTAMFDARRTGEYVEYSFSGGWGDVVTRPLDEGDLIDLGNGLVRIRPEHIDWLEYHASYDGEGYTSVKLTNMGGGEYELSVKDTKGRFFRKARAFEMIDAYS